MFYHDTRTQDTVRVDSPNPVHAEMLQPAQGGKGESSIMRRVPRLSTVATRMTGGPATGTNDSGAT